MQIGKLTNEELTEIVLDRLPVASSKVISGSAVGIDSARIDLESVMLMASSDPVTAGGRQTGRLAIHVSCNDIAAAGVRPSGILMVIIAPPKTSRQDLIDTVEQASATARELGIDIVGGHTEISDAVNRLIVTTTALGAADKSDLIPKGQAQLGDSLLMTKTAGIEGTWLAAMEREADLKACGLEVFVQQAQAFIKDLSVVKDGVLAASCQPRSRIKNSQGYGLSAVNLMHDATEGGILGAAYEMASLSGLGIEVFVDQIPLHEATNSLSRALELDPLRLIASGSMLIATPQPEDIIRKLSAHNILCTEIGRFVQEGYFEKHSDGNLLPLQAPKVDEIYKLFNKDVMS